MATVTQIAVIHTMDDMNRREHLEVLNAQRSKKFKEELRVEFDKAFAEVVCERDSIRSAYDDGMDKNPDVLFYIQIHAQSGKKYLETLRVEFDKAFAEAVDRWAHDMYNGDNETDLATPVSGTKDVCLQYATGEGADSKCKDLFGVPKNMRERVEYEATGARYAARSSASKAEYLEYDRLLAERKVERQKEHNARFVTSLVKIRGLIATNASLVATMQTQDTRIDALLEVLKSRDANISALIATNSALSQECVRRKRPREAPAA
jgi:hypothetical protein